MKQILVRFSLLLALCCVPLSHAVEILRWERIPLIVPLVVGQERVILVDRNIRVGVPPSVADRLRVQSAGGAIYLRASAPIETTRLELQGVESGALILIDVRTLPATQQPAALEPIRIIDATRSARQSSDREKASGGGADLAVRTDLAVHQELEATVSTPVAVVLTRYAAQSLYSPLRTIEPVPGITPVPLRGSLPLDTLLPGLPIRTEALLAWRIEDTWVTAVRLKHTTGGWLELDPRALQGDFVAATFQHQTLGPVGDCTDTTVLYLVTRGHELAQSLLPALSPVDGALNRQNLGGAADAVRGAAP